MWIDACRPVFGGGPSGFLVVKSSPRTVDARSRADPVHHKSMPSSARPVALFSVSCAGLAVQEFALGEVADLHFAVFAGRYDGTGGALQITGTGHWFPLLRIPAKANAVSEGKPNSVPG